jgi:hypothetical protein
MEETKGKLLVVLDMLELHRRTLSPSLSLRKKDTPIVCTNHVTATAQDPLR